MASMVIATEGSKTFDAYLATADAPLGAKVVLLPEMFGLTPAMCGAADRFAADGYTTLVANVFWRYTVPGVLAYDGPDRQTAWERIQALDPELAVRDIDAAAARLEDVQPDGAPVVAVGHCIGGRLAMLALPQTRLTGAISYYGLGVSRQGEALARMRKPAALHYGLADEHVPLGEIEAVTAAVAGNPAITIHRYEKAGHSFCNWYRPMYDEAAAALVRERTYAFLAERARSTTHALT